MRQTAIVIAAAVVAAALASGCGGSGSNGANDVEVTEFAVKESILTANKTYRVDMEGETAYLDQYASIHWPEELGGADLGSLRDSLMLFCFNDSTGGRDVKRSIKRFVTDTSVVGDSGVTVTPVDTLPDNDGEVVCYFNNVTATVMELDEEKATYHVTQSSYLGGAHPFIIIKPFTYVFSRGEVMSVDNMFTPEGRDSIMPVIKSALARQLDVPVSRLRRAGIFTSQLTYPGSPYIYNNIMYFHYNPYDIAPYSSGMIDVAVYPYEIEDLVQPWVRDLFDLGY